MPVNRAIIWGLIAGGYRVAERSWSEFELGDYAGLRPRKVRAILKQFAKAGALQFSDGAVVLTEQSVLAYYRPYYPA